MTEIEKQGIGYTWPSAGVLARTDWVGPPPGRGAGRVVALVATVHWISTHSAADISALSQDRGQFMPDGIMPAGHPETVIATERQIGVGTSKANLGPTFTNPFAVAANKLEGLTTTTASERSTSCPGPA